MKQMPASDNVCNKLQKAIRTICWRYQCIMLCLDRGPSQFCETSAKVTKGHLLATSDRASTDLGWPSWPCAKT